MRRSVLRQLAAWLGALCLLLGLAPSSGRAVLSGVYFTAVNDQLLEMNQETMPFWSGGELYVSSQVFSGAYGRLLGISYSPGSDRKTDVLYSGRSALYFGLETGTCYDNRGNNYEAKAVLKGNYTFFPLSTVCNFFDFTYSYSSTALVPLIRIKNSSVVLSDARFIDAASSSMRTWYNEYEAAVNSQNTASQPTEPEQGQQETGVKGTVVNLGIQVTGEEEARRVLRSFTSAQVQGTFLLTADQAEALPDLVRALVAGGQTIVLAVAAGEEQAALEELERGQEALWRAAWATTRLFWLESGQEKLAASLEEKGFCRITFDLDYSTYGVNNSGRVTTIMDRLAGRRSAAALLLGEDRLCGSVGTLLQRLKNGGYKLRGSR